MPALEQLGKDGIADRNCYLLELGNFDDLPARLNLPSKYFVCLLAWDESNLAPSIIANFAKKTLELGARAVSTWGPGCERVHDVFDQEYLAKYGYHEGSPVLMTTWHPSQSLEDTVWDVLIWISTDTDFADDCNSIVAITVGSQKHAAAIRSVFSNAVLFLDDATPNAWEH